MNWGWGATAGALPSGSCTVCHREEKHGMRLRRKSKQLQERCRFQQGSDTVYFKRKPAETTFARNLLSHQSWSLGLAPWACPHSVPNGSLSH